MELKPGDWLEHEAFRWRDRTAEVVEIREKVVLVYFKDEPGEEQITHALITRWWSKKLPPAGSELPYGFNPGRRFASTLGDHSTAVIHSVRPGWISYHQSSTVHGRVFRIAEFEVFDKYWKRSDPISAWERIQVGWMPA